MEKEEKKKIEQEIKERVFATPRNGDEAEPDLPTLEQLANGYISQSDGDKMMTKEDIIKKGTILQKIRLILANIDLNGYFEAEGVLSKAERIMLLDSIQTEEDRKLLDDCVKEYKTISNFGSRLNYFFKRFQTSFAVLAVLLNKWDSCEFTAKKLTLLYYITQTEVIAYFEGEPPEQWERKEKYPEEIRKRLIEDLEFSQVLDGAALKFDKEKGKFYVDVNEEGNLYSQIIEESKSVSTELSNFKAYVVVAEDYIKKSKLQYIPTTIKMSVENAKSERYTRFLVKNKRYFRSEINKKKAMGETITKEDEKIALIPDFYEVKPSRNILADCKEAIKEK